MLKVSFLYGLGGPDKTCLVGSAKPIPSTFSSPKVSVSVHVYIELPLPAHQFCSLAHRHQTPHETGTPQQST
jgi:hypothetical protein